MVSGRQKFIIGIVVVAIVSGCFWVIANAHPLQTAAQALILRAEEIGPGWDSGDGYADRSTDQGVISQSDHAYRPGNATGATVAFDVDLIIFDSKEIAPPHSNDLTPRITPTIHRSIIPTSP
jgi:hypothetical protein